MISIEKQAIKCTLEASKMTDVVLQMIQVNRKDILNPGRVHTGPKHSSCGNFHAWTLPRMRVSPTSA